MSCDALDSAPLARWWPAGARPPPAGTRWWPAGSVAPRCARDSSISCTFNLNITNEHIHNVTNTHGGNIGHPSNDNVPVGTGFSAARRGRYAWEHFLPLVPGPLSTLRVVGPTCPLPPLLEAQGTPSACLAASSSPVQPSSTFSVAVPSAPPVAPRIPSMRLGSSSSVSPSASPESPSTCQLPPSPALPIAPLASSTCQASSSSPLSTSLPCPSTSSAPPSPSLSNAPLKSSSTCHTSSSSPSPFASPENSSTCPASPTLASRGPSFI